jgi:hypothetical protein
VLARETAQAPVVVQAQAALEDGDREDERSRKAARSSASFARACASCSSFTLSKPRTCSGMLAISTARSKLSGARPASSSSTRAS